MSDAQQRHAISGSAEAAKFAGLVGDMIAHPQHVYDSMHESPHVVAYAEVWANPPIMPGVDRLSGNRIGRVLAYAGDTPEERVRRSISDAAEGLYSAAEVDDTTSNDEFLSRLTQLFGAKNLSALRQAILEKAPPQNPAGIDLVLPLLCVQALYEYHVDRVSRLSFDEQVAADTELDPIEAAEFYKQAEISAAIHRDAREAMSDQRIRPEYDSPHEQLRVNIMNHLRSCFTAVDSDDFRHQALDTLAPLYMDINRNRITPDEMSRLVADLASCGVDIREDLVRRKLGKQDRIAKAKSDLLFRSSDFMQRADYVHARILMAHYARNLVDGLANGTISYVNAMVLATTLLNRPLFMLAEKVEEINAERERARNEVILRAYEDAQRLGWKPLPIGKGTIGPRGTASPPTQARVIELDDYRRGILEDIAQMCPGSQIFYRKLRSGEQTAEATDESQADEAQTNVPKQPTGEREDDQQEQEEYYVLVIPRWVRIFGQEVLVFDAVAECREVGNAAYVWLAETGIVLWTDDTYEIVNTWEDVFSSNRPHARSLGAETFTHPTVAQRAAGEGKAAGMFRDVLLGHLTDRRRFGLPTAPEARTVGQGAIRVIRAHTARTRRS